MRTTLTIRTDDTLRRALERRAKESGTSMSDVARSILRQALEEAPLADRIGHLRGSLSLDGSEPSWRTRLRERNWRD